MLAAAAITILCVSANADAFRLRADWTLSIGETVRVSLRLTNESAAPARDLRLTFWGSPDPIALAAILPPRQTYDGEWTVARDDWASVYREVAVARIDYRDAAGRPQSFVVSAGTPPGMAARPPSWPRDLRFTLTRQDTARAGVVWWTPGNVGVLGPASWEANQQELEAAISPSSTIDGSETSIVAIVVPSGEGPASAVRVPIDARAPRPLWQFDARLPAAAAVAVVAVIALSALRRGGTRALLQAAPAIAFCGSVTALCLSLVPPALLFLPNTPGGGDYASQFVAFEYFRNTLLPRGSLYGWFPAHFGGFPLFLFYFPLVFLLAAAISIVAPLAVAMKLASLSGPALLPLAWFVSLRWLGAPPAARWLGAAAAVVFVLNEPQQVWGGNLASALAGEFAHALGFALGWLALACGWAHRDRPEKGSRTGLLLALTALAHAYAAVTTAVGLVLPVLRVRRWWPRTVNVAWTGLVAFLLLAWWLVPFFWHLPWTTTGREQWPAPWRTMLPATTWPLAGMAAAGVVRAAWRGARGQPIDANWRLLPLYALTMFGLAHVAYSIGLVNIRLLPVALGALLLAGAWELGAWVEKLGPRARAVASSTAIVSLLALAIAQVSYLPVWVRWNAHGLEYAPGWSDLRAIAERLRADGGGRVFYEHSAEHERLGTARAFEVLPFLAGRPTLEGLYMQSAVLAPAVLQVQAELSAAPSCSVVAFECGRYAAETGIAHARMLGADRILASSDRTVDALDGSAAAARLGRIGHHVLYQVNGAALAEPAAFRPVLSRAADWRRDAYDWWRAARDLEVPIVYGDASGTAGAVDRYRPGTVTRVPYSDRPTVTARAGNNRIELETTAPGHPVVVRVAYHPGWRADDGSRIALAAPGVMLVTPGSTTVVLRWSPGWIGPAATAISLVFAVALLHPRVRAVPARAAAHWRPGPAVGAAGVSFAVAAVLGIVVVSWRAHPPIDAPIAIGQGLDHLGRQEFAAAAARFETAARGAPPWHDDAAFYLGRVAADAGDAALARERWERFLRDFPVSTFRAEVLVRLARLDAAHGDRAQAAARLREALDTPLAGEGWRDEARAGLAIAEAAPLGNQVPRRLTPR